MPKGKHNSPKPKRVIPKAAEKLAKDMAAPKGNQFSKGIGRPEKDIDWDMFEQLCGIHCTSSEIASFLKVHQDTLRDRAIEHYGEEEYSIIYKKFQENGKCSLRRNQFVMSKSNASMAIWLGKQYLGQRDHEQTAEFSPQQLSQFSLVMDFLAKNQPSALNSAESNKSNEAKS